MNNWQPRGDRFRFLTGSDLRQVAQRRRILAKYVADDRLAQCLLEEADELERQAAETFRHAS